MKKLIVIILICLLSASSALAARTAPTRFWASSLTGGTTGCLDKISGADVIDGDTAMVGTSIYLLDDDSAAAENSPLVISPDTSAGTKRWILQMINGEHITDDTIDDDALDFTDITLADFTNDAGFLTSQTSHADVVQDGDFASQGIMLRGATSGVYSILTDNSANWNTAYGWGDHASGGYLLITGIDDTPADDADAPVSSKWLFDNWASKLSVADIDDTPVDAELAAPISSNWAYDHDAAADPHTGYALETIFGTSLNADDLLNNSGVLELQPEVPHIDAAQNWTESQEMADDKCWMFGTDSDCKVCWDSAAAVLEFRDSLDAPIFSFDLANYSIGSQPTALPKVLYYDSSGAGADLADKYAGSDWANFTTATEDAEVSDRGRTVMIGGYEIQFDFFDGSDESFTIGTYDGTNNPDSESIKWKFDTAARVIVSSPSGATILDHGSLDLATAGEITGAILVVPKTAATYTLGTDDTRESYGAYTVNTDNDTLALTLPAISVGMSGCLGNGDGVSAALTLDNTADYFIMDGVKAAAGEHLVSSGSATDQICWICLQADIIKITSKTGTWAEETPPE